MASAGRNHLTAEGACQSVCYSSSIEEYVSDMEYATFRLYSMFNLTIVVAVGDMGRSSSFCKRHYD